MSDLLNSHPLYQRAVDVGYMTPKHSVTQRVLGDRQHPSPVAADAIE